MKIIAIRDIKANIWGNIQLIPAIGMATRSFGDLCQDKNTDVGKHPEDYELYHLGEFNQDCDADKVIVLLDKPKQIDAGSNYY